MTIKRCYFADLKALVELGWAFHGKTIYAANAFDAEHFADTLRGYMVSGRGAVWMGDNAMAAAVLGKHPASGHTMASEVFLYSEGAGQGMRLLKAMKQWAEQEGALDLILTDQVNLQSLEPLYRRFGADPVERVYRVEL